MSTQTVHVEREPLVRMVKRDGISTKKAWLIRGISLGGALIVCALLIFMLTKLNPLKIYSAMFKGALGTPRRTWVTMRDTMMLLCISVGLAPAFKMRFWNIGAEGQVLIGGVATAACMIYLGGKVDLIIMRIVDIIYSLPDMLMVILLASVLKQSGLNEAIEGTILEKLGGNIISLFIIFALLYWVSMSRQIRGQILSLKEQEYVLAAKSTGAKASWVIRKHLLPNCISVVVISTALQIPSAIFTESYLSFLGLGVNAPMPSLGSLASDALNGITSYPYRLIIPAITISLIVLSLNLFGDGLRDAFDPKLKN